MQVVLLERVEKLGQIGKVVTVKDGYARNYLLPRGKALRATSYNLEQFEAQKAEIEARNLTRKQEAEAVAETLNGQSFIIIRQAADSGALYGSVSPRDIVDILKKENVTIDRDQIVLDSPVKVLGVHGVTIVLHADASARITLNVARSEQEAKIQMEGQSVAALRAAEDAKAEFDVAALFAENAAANAAEFGSEEE